MVSKRERMIAVLEVIITDTEADATKLDNTPFTSRAIGTVLGEMYATMQALAKIQLEILAPVALDYQLTPTDPNAPQGEDG